MDRKDHLRLLAKYTTTVVLLTANTIMAQSSYQGVIGGESNFNPYAAFVTSSGTATQITLPSITSGEIYSVSMNAAGQTLFGGYNQSSQSYVALLAASGSGIDVALPGLTGGGLINSVSINSSGAGIVGGNNNGDNVAYAAVVSSSGTATQVALPGLSGTSVLYRVQNNDAGQGIVGGNSNNVAYAALVTPSGTATQVTLPGGSGSSQINSVGINSSGQSIVGGTNAGGANGYVASITPSGTATQVIVGANAIHDVGINDAGQAIVAGSTSSSGAYAALISGSGAVTEVTIPGTVSGDLFYSAAINSTGQAIAGGGTASQLPFVSLISASGSATQVTLPGIGTSSGYINSVAINEFGQSLVGGVINNELEGYAALITAAGVATQISLPGLTGDSFIYSVALNPFFSSQLSTEGLSGNNRIFANYINEYAPELALYFIPATLDGTLAQALESAAPTRNAVSSFTADNTLFAFENSFSFHSVLQRWSQRRAAASSNVALVAQDQLLVANNAFSQGNVVSAAQEQRPYEVWFTLLAVDAFQKKQHQTTGFNPISGGVILGFDGTVTSSIRVGTAGAYAYTHIHENGGQGHSNIQQEYLSLYTMWGGEHLYTNASLWGGAFQISNVRNIKISGFQFHSTAYPHGWQLAPNFEIGYTFYPTSQWWCIEPFVMLDWVANWQGSYQEKGNSPFNAKQRHQFSSMLRSELSGRFYQTLYYTNWNFSFQEKVGYVNKKPFHVGKVNAFLVGFPGSFTVETLSTTQNLGIAQLQLMINPKKKVYPLTSFEYQGEFGSKYQSHTLSLELDWMF